MTMIKSPKQKVMDNCVSVTTNIVPTVKRDTICITTLHSVSEEIAEYLKGSRLVDRFGIKKYILASAPFILFDIEVILTNDLSHFTFEIKISGIGAGGGAGVSICETTRVLPPDPIKAYDRAMRGVI